MTPEESTAASAAPARWERRRSHAARSTLLGLVLLASFPLGPRRAQAQALPIIAGSVGGLAAGGWTTIGVFVARSRMGNYIFSLDDVQALRLETLPVLLFPLAGGILGARSSERLRSAGVGAGLGLVSGAVAGIALGTLVSDTSEAKWAGGIIGSATGLVIGAVAGGLSRPSDEGDPPSPLVAPLVTFRIPFGGGP